ncbi:MAG: hypothetical protein ABIW49_03600 [Knoellia sp.]
MTRRSRRASSVPQRVGSDEGLTSSRPSDAEASETTKDVEASEPEKASTRHTRKKVEQTKDDTDVGWGERGDDDASARWLRENRPPHWD